MEPTRSFLARLQVSTLDPEPTSSISILLPCSLSGSIFGTTTFNTPFSSFAWTPSDLTGTGNAKLLEKLPNTLSEDQTEPSFACPTSVEAVDCVTADEEVESWA